MADDADDFTPLPAAPAGVELAPRVRVPTAAVRFRFVRARGPGGQNVNKVSSACELRVSMSDLAAHLTPGAVARLTEALGSRLTAAGELQLVSDEKRTQEQNREAVLERLRDLLVRAMVEPKRRKKTRPSYGSKQRRLQGKRIRSEIKSGRRAGGRDD
jgi:ribosome-associated protein